MKKIRKSWQIEGGEDRDLLKAISTLNAAIRTLLEDWYPELAGTEWDISSGGVVTIYHEEVKDVF